MSTPKPRTVDDDACADDGAFREGQDDPHRLGRIYLRRRSLARERWELVFYRDEWWVWGSAYHEASALRSSADEGQGRHVNPVETGVCGGRRRCR
jgi:hypothetical protein